MYLIINFKTYSEATGENAVRLAEIVSRVETPADLDLVICPQAADIFRIRESYPNLTIWAQHIDPVEEAKNTGWTSATSLILAGATGTLINHSEHKLEAADIEKVLGITRHYQMVSCLAVPDTETAKSFASFQPDILAFEPPQLISTGTSLVDSDPQEAKDFITAMKDSDAKLVLGAGIADARDIQAAKELGYQGILLSSAFVKADEPEVFLKEIVAAFAS
jgi:triosephosphate isomerase (TIM)